MIHNINKDPNIIADSLKGRQSVRATFTLPVQSIHLLSIAATQLGLKQKSLFDYLVENKSTLDQVAVQAQNYHFKKKKRSSKSKRRQKTFVLNRSPLISLDLAAKEHRMPRDVLVELSIKRLLPVIDAEQERHENRKLLLKDLEYYLEQGNKLLNKTRKSIGEDDRIYPKLEQLVLLCKKNVAELKQMIKKGKCVEEFQ